MSGGGIGVFDMASQPRRYLGTIDGLAPGPRDLHVGPNGENLYVCCNSTGVIWKVPVAKIRESVKSQNSKTMHIKVSAKKIGAISGFAGLGVRSIKVSPDSEYLFAAVNQTSEVVAFPLPAVLTIDDGLNKDRLPSLKGIMAAKKKPREVKPATLGEQAVVVRSMALPPERAAGRILGEGADAVPELVRLLQTEAKVL